MQSNFSDVKKILIIQYKPFGDILLNTAYLPGLRKKFPNAQIDFLIQRPYRIVLEDNPHIDNLVIMEKTKNEFKKIGIRIKTILKVRKEKYDLVIDQLRGVGSAQITLFSGARYRLGWKLKKYNWVYNYLTPRDNLRYYALLKSDVLKPLNIKFDSLETFYHIKEKSLTYIDKWLKEVGLEGKPFLIVSPTSPVLYKQWDLASYAKTLDMVKEGLGLDIVFLWGPNELANVETIVAQMKTKAIIACKTNFNEAGALLKRGSIFFGNDGGVNHLAIAVKTPSVAIFGPHTNPIKWQANHIKTHTFLRNWDCKDKTDRRLGISPEMAFKELKKMYEMIK